MPIITINNKPYDTDKLSDQAKAELQMIQLTDQELARLKSQTAIVQTARNAYARALAKLLAKENRDETLKFN